MVPDTFVVPQFNMREFVRVRFDDTDFTNENYLVEGSRCAAKVPWFSRMDLIPNRANLDPATGIARWMRNGLDNQIDLGYFILTTDPTDPTQ